MSIPLKNFIGVPAGGWICKIDPNPVHHHKVMMSWGHKCVKPGRYCVVYSSGGVRPQPTECKYCVRDIEETKKNTWHHRLWRWFVAVLHTKSVKKTISWRVLAILLTILTVWVITGSLAIAGSIGGIDAVLKTVFYWLHEEAWERIEKKGSDEG